MIFRPFYYFDTGCAAYVFGCGGLGLGAVVDPQERDVDSYLEFAQSKGLRLTHVFETHVHADHRSGGRLLAEKTGASYCLHRSADVAFSFTPLHDSQQVELGNTRLTVLHTPGHTPESVAQAPRRPGRWRRSRRPGGTRAPTPRRTTGRGPTPSRR